MKTVIRKLEERRYSPSTIKTYISCLERFFATFKLKKREEISSDDIQKYLHKLVKSKYSLSTQNQHINAIKFYFEHILKRDRQTYYIDRPRKEKPLPQVLSKNEMSQLILNIQNLKHKAAVSLCYSAGLRVSEVINLKLSDIDSTRMVIHIRQSKGAKDRYVPLSLKILALLRKYYKAYKPEEFLFNGQNAPQYSAKSIRAVIKRAAIKADIKKRVTTHTLRHSYATHLLESGTDLRYIKELLGHNSFKTVEIYTHVSNNALQRIGSPIDSLDINL